MVSDVPEFILRSALVLIEPDSKGFTGTQGTSISRVALPTMGHP